MNRDGYLLLLTLTGSALCWWPAAIEPSIDFPRWTLLVLIVLITGLSVFLSSRHWLRFVIAAIIGSFGGMSTAAILFPSSDDIANSYRVIVIGIGTVAVAFVSLLSGLVARRMSISRQSHGRLAWLALMCCVACGPVAFALTPPLVAHRVAQNDRLAAQRFRSLKAAVEHSLSQDRVPARICDGQFLMQHYSGPSFGNEDWERITGNYVRQDGYMFMIYCHEKGGYTINACQREAKLTAHAASAPTSQAESAVAWNGIAREMLVYRAANSLTLRIHSPWIEMN